MPYTDAIERIQATLAHGPESQRLAPEDGAKIEHEVDSLGGFPGAIGDAMMALRRALYLLKMKHANGDDEAILLASVHVREVWDTVQPALEKISLNLRQEGLAPFLRVEPIEEPRG